MFEKVTFKRKFRTFSVFYFLYEKILVNNEAVPSNNSFDL
jgi:hypothetical protein